MEGIDIFMKEMPKVLPKCWGPSDFQASHPLLGQKSRDSAGENEKNLKEDTGNPVGLPCSSERNIIEKAKPYTFHRIRCHQLK